MHSGKTPLSVSEEREWALWETRGPRGHTGEKKCKYRCLHSETVARDTQWSSHRLQSCRLCPIVNEALSDCPLSVVIVFGTIRLQMKNALKFKSHLKSICGTEMSRLCGEVTICTRGFKGFCLIFIFLLQIPQIIHLSMNQSIFSRKAQSFPQMCSHFRCGLIHIWFLWWVFQAVVVFSCDLLTIRNIFNIPSVTLRATQSLLRKGLSLLSSVTSTILKGAVC